MSDRIITTALILLATAAPAFASITLPEPTTVSLFGVGVCGAYLAKRLIGRK